MKKLNTKKVAKALGAVHVPQRNTQKADYKLPTRSPGVVDTNQMYVDQVEAGIYPGNIFVPLGEVFEDERGVIQNLLCTSDLKTVSLLTSKAGTERSNHYHRTDYHYLYVISGSMEYYEREVQSPFDTKFVLVKAGEMIFTPPMMVHKTVFREDTLLLSCAKNVRNHQQHEADLIREKF